MIDTANQYDPRHGRNISCQLHLVDLCTQLEGRYYECSDIEEFFDYVASKLLPSRTSPGRQPVNGVEVRRWVTEVCQERRQALLARKFLPYRNGDRESLDRAIDCWLEIEGRRSLQEAVSALLSSYRLAFGPEESTAEFLLSTTCRSRIERNQEHVVNKTSEIGKVNSVVSMRLIQRIEALEPKQSGGPSSSQFQGRHGKQGLEHLAQLTAKPRTMTVNSSAFSPKQGTTCDPDAVSSRVASPSEPGSACTPIPCTDPFVSMPNRMLRHPEATARRQRVDAEPQMLQARGGNDLSRSTPKKSSTGTQTTPDKSKSTSFTQTYGRSWDPKSHVPDNADTGNAVVLGSDTDEAFSQSAKGSGTQPSPVPPIRRRTPYQHNDKTSARLGGPGGPAVKTKLFPATHKKKLQKNNKGAAAFHKVLGDASTHSSPGDASARGLRSNATAYQPPSSSSRTRATTAHSTSPRKMTMPKASPPRERLVGDGYREEYRYPSSRWSPGSANAKSSPHQQHRTTTGYAIKPARDARDTNNQPTPSTPTNTIISRGNALPTAENGSRGRRRNQAPAQQPLPTPCSDRKRKLHHVLDDDIGVDIVDLTISSDECKGSQGRRKESRNSRSLSAASAATFRLEQRLANLEKLVGLQDEKMEI